MNRMGVLTVRTVLLGLLTAFWLIPGCDKLGGGGIRSSGLKPGLNYMQPMKWRVTYNYWIKNIEPEQPFIKERRWTIDPAIATVGNGTCEVWFAGPREGEEIRGVKRIYASPEPTAITRTNHDAVELSYYDFTPKGELPKEIQASMQWEFYTFERYTYWEGMPKVEYDKTTDLYKLYTQEVNPIISSADMRKVAKSCIPEDPLDYTKTAMGCYNYIVSNFNYDMSQEEFFLYSGGQALFDAARSWQNKAGICDEFASVQCAMLRSVGIPARPVAGWVHQIFPQKSGESALILAGHAWAEYYVPEVGWVPLDPTWGMDGGRDVIEPIYSLTGNLRGIPTVDYYFGKTDPLRITLFKDWNTELQPPPKTPNADKSEMWFVGCTDRTSGIDKVTYGWEGVPPMPTRGGGWFRSTEFEGQNFRPEVECLGPVNPKDIPEIIADIKAEGAHFLRVPPTPGKWPKTTTDLLSQIELPDPDDPDYPFGL